MNILVPIRNKGTRNAAHYKKNAARIVFSLSSGVSCDRGCKAIDGFSVTGAARLLTAFRWPGLQGYWRPFGDRGCKTIDILYFWCKHEMQICYQKGWPGLQGYRRPFGDQGCKAIDGCSVTGAASQSISFTSNASFRCQTCDKKYENLKTKGSFRPSENYLLWKVLRENLRLQGNERPTGDRVCKKIQR